LILISFLQTALISTSSHSLSSSLQRKPSRNEDEIAHWSAQLKSSDEEARREAVMNLSRFDGDAATSALIAALSDSSPSVRAAAVAGLGERANETIAVLLARRLAEDKDQFVRKTAAYALGRFHGVERTAGLIVALKAKDAEVRGAAAVSLGDHAEAAAVQALTSALTDKSAFVRAQAARALGVNGTAASGALASLIARLNSDDDSEVRRQSATALGRIGDRSALTSLERATRSKDPYLAQAALEAIRAIKK